MVFVDFETAIHVSIIHRYQKLEVADFINISYGWGKFKSFVSNEFKANVSEILLNFEEIM